MELIFVNSPKNWNTISNLVVLLLGSTKANKNKFPSESPTKYLCSSTSEKAVNLRSE